MVISRRRREIQSSQNYKQFVEKIYPLFGPHDYLIDCIRTTAANFLTRTLREESVKLGDPALFYAVVPGAFDLKRPGLADHFQPGYRFEMYVRPAGSDKIYETFAYLPIGPHDYLVGFELEHKVSRWTPSARLSIPL